MTMTFVDRAPIESVRRLPDGRLAAVVKFARSGTQVYLGSEVGRPDLSSVTVYRSEDEVFHEDAMASFAHKSITLGHPSEPVTADNWKRLSVGFTEGRVARNGAFLEIPMMVADASAISAIDSGTAKQLSAGYSCELQWGDGVAPDGTPYQAKQVGIKANHIAIVAEARGGPELRIGDARQQNLADYRAKGMADAKAFSAARYAGAPMIEAADSENPTQPSMADHYGSDATAAIRRLRYQ
ncbi:DUF2213 domain-containing protein [Sphingorhabdus contaminans]|uniref:DUF2213 domain-containing protein n=1 Tax=Sphingorhabdus contaminans TaxID=1343899 RepID=A0A553WIR8_9SPHN|nr:DUF2213 domain-containing protein [Sphingorhabdus contaminans]TSB04573.1 DUF2213 domain-containing protein [Sphingorhabdus contaminans]